MRLYACGRFFCRASACFNSAMASICWKFFDGPHSRNALATWPSGSAVSSSKARWQWNSAFSSHFLGWDQFRNGVSRILKEESHVPRAKSGSRATAFIRG